MPRITPISWKRFEKFLLFIGCKFVREKGDHRIYDKPKIIRPVVIPREKQLPIFVIRNNLYSTTFIISYNAPKPAEALAKVWRRSIRILNVSHDEYLEILDKL